MSRELWRFLPVGYFFTILIETPILLFGLSPQHSARRRLLAGIWLTACTYPIVVLVLPLVFADQTRLAYLSVAEVFAPVAECVLFGLAFGLKDEQGKTTAWRDFAVIAIANLASFGAGEIFNTWQWFGWFS
jgi:hypothetical protein